MGKLESNQCHEEIGAGRRVERARESNLRRVWWWWSVKRGVIGLVRVLHHAQMVVLTGRREGVERDSKDRMSEEERRTKSELIGREVGKRPK